MGSQAYLKVNGKRCVCNMIDLVKRIDALLVNTPASEMEEFQVCRCLRDARSEIESLRLAIRRLAEQDATLSVCDGSVTVTMDAAD